MYAIKIWYVDGTTSDLDIEDDDGNEITNRHDLRKWFNSLFIAENMGDEYAWKAAIVTDSLGKEVIKHS